MNNEDKKDQKPAKILQIKEKGQEVWNDLFDMRGNIDRAGTIISIKKNMRMYGANAYMLIFSILLASLGLNLDSPAVIIGAMLISPLMSPILGVGLAVGINDRDTLMVSLKHFAISILIALTVSTLYFALTPLSVVTSEITARTKPTLLDGLVAIAGGFAGIISTVQKDKSNAIPGVAIATALMPPLCVAGFGIASFDWDYFINSFYLFFLNSFFIAISTFVVVRFLKFPHKSFQTEKERKRTSQLITLFSVLIIIPSTYIFWGILDDVKEEQSIKNFIENTVNSSKHNVVNYVFDSENDSVNILVLSIIGDPYEQSEIDNLQDQLNDISTFSKPVKLKTIQADVGLEDFKEVQDKLSLVEGDLKEKLNQSLVEKIEKEQTIRELSEKVDSLKSYSSLSLPDLSNGIQIAFEDVEEIAFGTAKFPQDSFQTEMPVAIIGWKKNIPRSRKKKTSERLNSFLKLNLAKDSIIVVSK